MAGVASEHKKRTRELKAQIVRERAEWEKEKTELDRLVSSLTRSRDELRELVREQREQLQSFRALIEEGKKEAKKTKKSRIGASAVLPTGIGSFVVDLEEKKERRGAVSDGGMLMKREREEKKEEEERKKAGGGKEEEEEEEWLVVELGTKGATPFKETVRGKKRLDLPEADDCDMCRRFFDAMAQETGLGRERLVHQCTRHRSRHPEVPTPPGYWDVGM